MTSDLGLYILTSLFKFLGLLIIFIYILVFSSLSRHLVQSIFFTLPLLFYLGLIISICLSLSWSLHLSFSLSWSLHLSLSILVSPSVSLYLRLSMIISLYFLFRPHVKLPILIFSSISFHFLTLSFSFYLGLSVYVTQSWSLHLCLSILASP